MADTNLSLPGEIWKPIPGYETRYEVSSLGRVRSFPLLVEHGPYRSYVHPASGKVLRQSVRKTGHRTLFLYSGEQGDAGTRRYVHHLVCEAFHGPRPNGMLALHGDGDANNNRADNLRWGTPQENSDDMVRHGRSTTGETHPRAKLSDEQVRELRSKLTDGSLSIRKAAVAYGVSWQHVFKLKHGYYRPDA